MLPILALVLTAGAAPDWGGTVAGQYAGRIRNEGRMECQKTQFVLQSGELVGHYRIEADDPFEGDLTDFVPDPPEPGAAPSGTFTWSDKFGTGVEHVHWAPDGSVFWAEWGVDEPLPGNQGWGQRGGTSDCLAAVS
jgi:hypothetical protein